MASTFGQFFRVTTFGESHGRGVGAVVDGCPARIPISAECIQRQLDRRRPGQSALSTPRREADRAEILSGVMDGLTLGTPIAILVANEDARASDYLATDTAPRPSHADYTYLAKYGIRARSGGGRASARETIGRVAGGAVAQALLSGMGVDIVAWVSRIGDVDAKQPDLPGLCREQVDRFPVRTPDADDAGRMQAAIETAIENKDSLGGVVTCVCRRVPPGWGEPVFNKLEAMLAHAMLSIPAVKGFDIGSGFAGTRMSGSSHNDRFVRCTDKPAGGTVRLATTTNFSGGVQGGISNGEPIRFRVAFKPVATIGQPQQTANYEGNPVTLTVNGRHDPCVLPRAVAIVECMTALVLADAALAQSRMALGNTV